MEEQRQVQFQIMASHLGSGDSIVMRFSQPHVKKVPLQRSSAESPRWVSPPVSLPLGNLVSYSYCINFEDVKEPTQTSKNYQLSMSRSIRDVIDDGRFVSKYSEGDWCKPTSPFWSHESRGSDLANRLQQQKYSPLVEPAESCTWNPSSSGLAALGARTFPHTGFREAAEVPLERSCGERQTCVTNERLQELLGLDKSRRDEQAEMGERLLKLEKLVTEQLQAEMSAGFSKLEGAVAESKQVSELQKSSCGRLEGEVERLHREVRGLKETQTLEAEMNGRILKLEGLAAESKELNELQKFSCGRLEGDIKDLRREVAGLKETRALEAEMNGRILKLERLAAESKELNELQRLSCGRLEGDIKDLCIEVAGLKETRALEAAARMDELEQKVVRLRDLQQPALQRLAEALDGLQEDVRKLEGEVQRINLQSLQPLQKKVHNLKTQAIHQVQEIGRKLSVQQSRLDCANEEIKSVRVDTESLSTAHRKLVAQQRPARKRLGDLEGKTEALYAGVEDLLSRERAALAAEVQGMRAQLMRQLVDREDLRAVEDKVEGVRGQLQQQQEQQHVDVEDLRAVQDMAARLASLENSAKQQQQHRQAPRDEAVLRLEREQKREFTSLRHDLNDLRDRLDLQTQKQERAQEKDGKDVPRSPASSGRQEKDLPPRHVPDVENHMPRKPAATPAQEREERRSTSAREQEKEMPRRPAPREEKEPPRRPVGAALPEQERDLIHRLAYFNTPPHPEDAKSRAITFDVERVLLQSREAGASREERMSLLKRVSLSVHPDKGGTHQAFNWWTAWKEFHQEWFLQDVEVRSTGWLKREPGRGVSRGSGRP